MTGKMLAIIAAMMFAIGGAAALLPNDMVYASASSGIPVEVEISGIDGNCVVKTANYSAIIDGRYGNMLSFSDKFGNCYIGSENGQFTGVCACWNDSDGNMHVQKSGGSCPEASVSAYGNAVYVNCSSFQEKYVFSGKNFHVIMKATEQDLLNGNDFHLYFTSIPIYIDTFFTLPYHNNTYKELTYGNYLTDIATDESAGRFSILHIHRLDSQRLYRETVSLEGMGIWWFRCGKVWFEKGADLKIASADHQDICYFHQNGNGGDADFYSASYASEFLSTGDVVDIAVNFNFGGYDVIPINYPVSTDTGTNDGVCPGKIVVPKNKPASGFKLIIMNHGMSETSWSNSYMWDFLGNEGYVVASSNWTSETGNSSLKDWGYSQQIEIEDLRQYVLSNYEVDLSRQYAIGISLGGLNTFLCATNHPQAYAAIVPESPVYDFSFFLPPVGDGASMAFGTSTDQYIQDAGNPRIRKDQLTCPITLLSGTVMAFNTIYLDGNTPAQEGANELAILASQGIIGAMVDHPDANLILCYGTGHERRTWESYRKEIWQFLESNVLPEEKRNSVSGQFYGRCTNADATPGYNVLPEKLHYRNIWMDVELPDDSFITLEASKVEDGTCCKYTFKSDLAANIAFAIPEWTGIGIYLNGVEIGESSSDSINFEGKLKDAVCFTADAGTDYELRLEKLEDADKAQGGALIPGFEFCTVALAAAFALFFAARRRIS